MPFALHSERPLAIGSFCALVVLGCIGKEPYWPDIYIYIYIYEYNRDMFSHVRLCRCLCVTTHASIALRDIVAFELCGCSWHFWSPACVCVCVCVCCRNMSRFLICWIARIWGSQLRWVHVGLLELIGHMCRYGPTGPIWAIMGPRTISNEQHGITRRACKLQHGGISHLYLRAIHMNRNGQFKMLDTTMS